MLTQLVTKLFTGEAGIYIGRLRRVALVYALIAVFALGAVGFLVAALFAWLAGIFGFVATAIGFAIVCLVTVLALSVVLVSVRRPPRVRASDRLQRDIASIAGVAAVSNLPLIFASVRRRKGLLLLPVAAVTLWSALRAFGAHRRRRW